MSKHERRLGYGRELLGAVALSGSTASVVAIAMDARGASVLFIVLSIPVVIIVSFVRVVLVILGIQSLL